MAGSHDLGPELPRQRSIFTSREPVNSLAASETAYLGNISELLQAQPPAPEHETTDPRGCLVVHTPSLCCKCSLFSVLYSPMEKKCFSIFPFYPILGISSLGFPSFP